MSGLTTCNTDKPEVTAVTCENRLEKETESGPLVASEAARLRTYLINASSKGIVSNDRRARYSN